MESKHIGMGVVICEKVIDIDQQFLFEYIVVFDNAVVDKRNFAIH